MGPESIDYHSMGSFFGLASNVVMAFLCLITFFIYRHYRPLGALFLFYLLLALFFLGFIIYRLQRSPESILYGYRLTLAALSLLPASWVWFASAILGERLNRFSWMVTGVSLFLAFLALFGQGPWLLGLPLEPHPTGIEVLRPQSKLLLPSICLFGLVICLFYLWIVTERFFRFKDKRPVFLLPFGVGLFFWFLGGLHDSLLSIGVVTLFDEKVLGFASFWLSIFLTITIALHYRSLDQAVRETRDVFERFVPPAYLRRIAAKGLQSIRLGEADQQDVTVLCCDIRGFTPLSERMEPSHLISFVNQLLERFTKVVTRHQGIIDKYLGDAVLCIFEDPDSAKKAVECGLDMLATVKSFNDEKGRLVKPTVQIGVGLHTGPVILGTIGSSERMDSTVLGFTVNMAKHLEELTKHFGVNMLISNQVLNHLSPAQEYHCRELGEILMKDSLAPMSVFEVYDQDTAESKHLKDLMKPMMAESIKLFKEGRLEAALSKLQEAQHISSEDLPLRLLINSVKNALEHGQLTQGASLLIV